MGIKLVELTYEYKKQLAEMIDEWKLDQKINNTNHSPWAIFKNDYHDFEYYLNNLDIKEIDPTGKKVMSSTYFALDEERNIFVGATNIRHYFNEGLLYDGGHIGDGVRPSERRKGYATKIIELSLEKCKEIGLKRVLICCDKNNIGSKKSIIKNGGILESEVITEENSIEQRYFIELTDTNKLVGENIVLRKARMSDLNAILLNIWSDENIYKTMWFAPTFTKEEAKDRLLRTINFQNLHDAYFVCLKGSDEAIGMAGVIKEENGIYKECGICIASRYQNKGYGKEVLSLLLDLVFNKLNANKFIYSAMKENYKSKGLKDSFNFKYLKTITDTRPWDNKKFEIDYYYLDKEDYQK